MRKPGKQEWPLFTPVAPPRAVGDERGGPTPLGRSRRRLPPYSEPMPRFVQRVLRRAHVQRALGLWTRCSRFCRSRPRDYLGPTTRRAQAHRARKGRHQEKLQSNYCHRSHRLSSGRLVLHPFYIHESPFCVIKVGKTFAAPKAKRRKRCTKGHEKPKWRNRKRRDKT